MFAFALDTSALEELKIITYIEDVKNLENNKTILGYRKLRLINVEDISNFKSEIEKAIQNYDNNGSIYLLDKNLSILTGTFMSNIKIVKFKKSNVILGGWVWHQPKGYYKAWRMADNNEIDRKNIWQTFDKDELQGWLVFALNYKNINTHRENIKIHIDGNKFHNLDEFFCLLGEEVNGIGGYFGRNLYALYDCLRGDFGVKSVSELIWSNHEKSKRLLNSKFNEIIEIFKEVDTKIILS